MNVCESLFKNEKWRERLASSYDEEQKSEWLPVAEAMVNGLIECLPHGSGIDGDTTASVVRKEVQEKRDGVVIKITMLEVLEIHSEYHRMDEFGGYAGWFGFTISVTPALDGASYDFRVDWSRTGLSNRELDELYGDYLVDIFAESLRGEV